VFLDKFKELAHLIELGVLAGRLDREGAREFRVRPDGVTALGATCSKPKARSSFSKSRKGMAARGFASRLL
jgi:hypothetical protein